MPLGGSMVILTPFCRIDTGKLPLGMLVSHSRKSRCVLSSVMSSVSFSSVAIQLSARWQFCRHTQCPLSTASAIAFSAIGPCPCPNDTDTSRRPMPSRSARLSSSVIGSAPGDSTNTSGE